MENEENQLQKTVGEIRKRTERMPDGKRYIIFYTFGDDEPKPEIEVKENV